MTEWEALRQECLRCHACTLAETRTNVVFGVGRAKPPALTRTSRVSPSWAGAANCWTIC